MEGLTMTHAQSSGAPAPRAEDEPLGKWLSLAAALAVGGAFFALWVWVLPGWLGFRVETAGGAPPGVLGAGMGRVWVVVGLGGCCGFWWRALGTEMGQDTRQ